MGFRQRTRSEPSFFQGFAVLSEGAWTPYQVKTTLLDLPFLTPNLCMSRRCLCCICLRFTVCC